MKIKITNTILSIALNIISFLPAFTQVLYFVFLNLLEIPVSWCLPLRCAYYPETFGNFSKTSLEN